ncbi:integrase core domain-containing protein [Pseudodesulfovibrio mercurii]|uniref:integrase core domain-containing protein n=1 Tax=Pseudodesulfovibrio mercurii TaxID=641491 RepID=UPI0009DAADA0
MPIARSLTNEDVTHVLAALFTTREQPDYLRSDNGSEFAAEALCGWLKDVGVNTASIKPGSPGENGYSESFNGKLPEGWIHGELLCSLKEAQIVIENRRREYDTIRPHGSLEYQPPASVAPLGVELGSGWTTSAGRVQTGISPDHKPGTGQHVDGFCL